MRYEIGDFILDTDRVELTSRDTVVPLEPKIYDLLNFLISNRDRVVSKDEIFDHVWPGVFVSEASISAAVKQLRKALGDDGEAQRFVRTVRGKGFRFVAEVSEQMHSKLAAIVAAAAPIELSTDGASSPPVVAVLPFKLIRSEEAHGAIAEGIPIELISALSRLRSVRVIARGSTFQFNPDSLDLDGIRSRLGAWYVLSGSVELVAKRLFLTAELTDTRTRRVIWSDTFSGPLDDIFLIRQSLVSEVCAAIELRIPLNEAEALAHVPSENLDAWGHYHIGIRHLFRFNGADNDLARHHMQRAIALDPGFARAHAGLSYAELEDYNLFYGGDRQDSWTSGQSMAERGADLDPFDPFCNLALGRAKWMSGRLDEAIGWVDRSVALNPNYAFGHYNLGKLNAIACVGNEADQFAASAMSLSPIDPHMQSMLSTRALAGYVAENEDNALLYAGLSLRAPNPHLYVRVIAAAIYAYYDRADLAQHAAQDIGQSYEGFTKDHFQTLFTLKDAQKDQALVAAISKLGL